MKKTTPLSITILTAILLLTSLTDSYSFHRGKDTRPYGDYCTSTSHYGHRQGTMSKEKSEESLKHYYSDKGLDIVIINNRGKFIRALVKDGDATVDIIIFDRRSGRLRSVH